MGREGERESKALGVEILLPFPSKKVLYFPVTCI
jgi:hypothetical protein